MHVKNTAKIMEIFEQCNRAKKKIFLFYFTCILKQKIVSL